MIFAGGGTGGHVYPAVAVAREFQKRMPDIEIHFVGSRHGLENKIIPKEGFFLHTLNVGGLINTSRLAQLKTLILMPLTLIQSLILLLKIRPQFVLGVGGFAAGPFVLVASLIGKKTYIWEPNAHPGFTNRILSRFVQRAFIVFEDAAKKLKSREKIIVGLPVRSSISFLPRVGSNELRVLVFGGSQGARPINNAVAEAFTKYADKLKGILLVHQTGALDFERISKMYHNAPSITCFQFIDDMAHYYHWADIVIGRGGVGTVSEVIACRKAAVIVPLPTAAENHQQANAEVLVRANAGEMLLQKDLSAEKVVETLIRFRDNPQLIESYENKLMTLQRPNGSSKIVDEILKDL